MTTEQLPYGRNKADQELKQIIEQMDDNETHALKFGMLPAQLEDKNMSNKDVARMMKLNPEGHF